MLNSTSVFVWISNLGSDLTRSRSLAEAPSSGANSTSLMRAADKVVVLDYAFRKTGEQAQRRGA